MSWSFWRSRQPDNVKFIMEPMIKNYDNFFLPAQDMEQSKDFYANVLGLRLKFEFAPKGMAAFGVGGEEPAIILKDVGKNPDVRPTIWFEVDDVAAAYEELKAKGVEFISGPFKIGTGWAAEFNDPSGNRLGITDYKE